METRILHGERLTFRRRLAHLSRRSVAISFALCSNRRPITHRANTSYSDCCIWASRYRNKKVSSPVWMGFRNSKGFILHYRMGRFRLITCNYTRCISNSVHGRRAAVLALAPVEAKALPTCRLPFVKQFDHFTSPIIIFVLSQVFWSVDKGDEGEVIRLDKAGLDTNANLLPKRVVIVEYIYEDDRCIRFSQCVAI